MTTHPKDKVLKMIGVLYEEGKRREDWVGSIGESDKEISI